MSFELSQQDIISQSPEFQLYDDALTDPYLKFALQKAAEFNTLMASESVSLADALEIQQTLDDLLKDIVSQEITVTGNITTLTPAGDQVTRFYDQHRMIANGFYVTRESDEESDHEMIGRKAMLHFYIEIPENEKDNYFGELAGSTHLIGSAELDQVEILVDGVSFDRAKAWLTVFIPELIDEVDQIILNAEGDDAEIIMALQDFEINTGTLSQEDREFAIECIGVYISGVVDIDKRLPFLVEISGKIIIKDPGGNDVYGTMSHQKSRFMYISDLSAIEVGVRNTKTNQIIETNVQILLDAVIVNNDPSGYDLKAKVPLDSILNVKSIRHLTEPDS